MPINLTMNRKNSNFGELHFKLKNRKAQKLLLSGRFVTCTTGQENGVAFRRLPDNSGEFAYVKHRSYKSQRGC